MLREPLLLGSRTLALSTSLKTSLQAVDLGEAEPIANKPENVILFLGQEVELLRRVSLGIEALVTIWESATNDGFGF